MFGSADIDFEEVICIVCFRFGVVVVRGGVRAGRGGSVVGERVGDVPVKAGNWERGERSPWDFEGILWS